MYAVIDIALIDMFLSTSLKKKNTTSLYPLIDPSVAILMEMILSR